MFSRLPVKKLSRQSTSFPSLRSRSQRCEPMNPAPPVTNILIDVAPNLRSLRPSRVLCVQRVSSMQSTRRAAETAENILFSSHRVVPEIKHVHLRLLKTIDRLPRRANDRLVLIE